MIPAGIIATKSTSDSQWVKDILQYKIEHYLHDDNGWTMFLFWQKVQKILSTEKQQMHTSLVSTYVWYEYSWRMKISIYKCYLQRESIKA